MPVDSARRRQAARDGARRRVVRGERWRTAPGGESMATGSARRRAVRDGARPLAVRGLTKQVGAELRAAAATAQGVGLRKGDSARRQTV
eukprot:3893551-Pleurochrysis_carterae.AAC.1